MLLSAFAFAACAGLAAGPSASPPLPPKRTSAGIYRTAADFRHRTPALLGNNVRPSLLRRKLVLVQKAVDGKRKQLVPADSVWGYVARNGQEYRYFRRKYYEVLQADSLVLYGYKTSFYGSAATRAQGSTVSSTTVYYFSTGAQAPLQLLTKGNLRKSYQATNPRFLALLDQRKWYQGLLGYDAASKTYRVVALYRESLKQ